MDLAGGHAHMCFTRRQISSYNGAGADDGRVSDSDTGKYIRAGADENREGSEDGRKTKDTT